MVTLAIGNGDGGRRASHALLAIDTSVGTSVAVGEVEERKGIARDSAQPGSGKMPRARARVLGAATSLDRRGHAEQIAVHMQGALAEAEKSASDIEAVIVGVGPGPFTGLRVGIAAACGFAAARELPIVGILSHEAIACSAQFAGARGVRHIVQPAGRNEQFATTWRLGEIPNELRLLAGPRLAPITESGTDPLNSEWHGEGDPEFAGAPTIEATSVPASSLLHLAAMRIARGLEFLPAQAIYLREPDAKVPRVRKRVST